MSRLYRHRGVFNLPEPDFGDPITGEGEYVVGLDPSLTAYGITVMSLNNSEDWSTWVIKVKSRGAPRLVQIREHILTRLTGLDLRLAVMEGYSYGSSKSQSHKAGELGGTIKTAFHDASLPLPHTMAPSSLKKFATGSGNASKSEMLLQVYKRWGVEFDDDNAADAYALARAAFYLINHGSEEITKFQRDCLSKIGEPEG